MQGDKTLNLNSFSSSAATGIGRNKPVSSLPFNGDTAQTVNNPSETFSESPARRTELTKQIIEHWKLIQNAANEMEINSHWLTNGFVWIQGKKTTAQTYSDYATRLDELIKLLNQKQISVSEARKKFLEVMKEGGFEVHESTEVEAGAADNIVWTFQQIKDLSATGFQQLFSHYVGEEFAFLGSIVYSNFLDFSSKVVQIAKETGKNVNDPSVLKQAQEEVMGESFVNNVRKSLQHWATARFGKALPPGLDRALASGLTCAFAEMFSQIMGAISEGKNPLTEIKPDQVILSFALGLVSGKLIHKLENKWASKEVPKEAPKGNSNNSNTDTSKTNTTNKIEAKTSDTSKTSTDTSGKTDAKTSDTTSDKTSQTNSSNSSNTNSNNKDTRTNTTETKTTEAKTGDAKAADNTNNAANSKQAANSQQQTNVLISGEAKNSKEILILLLEAHFDGTNGVLEELYARWKNGDLKDLTFQDIRDLIGIYMQEAGAEQIGSFRHRNHSSSHKGDTQNQVNTETNTPQSEPTKDSKPETSQSTTIDNETKSASENKLPDSEVRINPATRISSSANNVVSGRPLRQIQERNAQFNARINELQNLITDKKASPEQVKEYKNMLKERGIQDASTLNLPSQTEADVQADIEATAKIASANPQEALNAQKEVFNQMVGKLEQDIKLLQKQITEAENPEIKAKLEQEINSKKNTLARMQEVITTKRSDLVTASLAVADAQKPGWKGKLTAKQVKELIQSKGKDLAGYDLNKEDFQGANFEKVKFRNTALRYAKFMKASFISVSFAKADLEGTSFRQSELDSVNLSEANLRFALFYDATFKNVNFNGANLSSAHLQGANLEKADLRFANLDGTYCEGTNFEEANLSGMRLNCFLKKADLRKANLEGTSFSTVYGQSNLVSRSNLEEANLEGANLKAANLSGINLQGSVLKGANLENTNLVGANLSNANLEGLNLSNMDLKGVVLEGAKLEGVKLAGANLSNANLKGLDLSEMDLTGVNLQGANLYETKLPPNWIEQIKDNEGIANLSNANLKGLDLSEMDLTGVNLQGANLHEAKLPSNWIEKIRNKEGIVDLSYSNLKGLDLSKMDLKGAILEGANLFETKLPPDWIEQIRDNEGVINLKRTILENQDLSKTDLRGAILEGANLYQTKLPPNWTEQIRDKKGIINLKRALLQNQDLSKMDLQGAILEGANLKGANLTETNLRLANLENANLEGVDLSKTELKGANLRKADLSNANLPVIKLKVGTEVIVPSGDSNNKRKASLVGYSEGFFIVDFGNQNFHHIAAENLLRHNLDLIPREHLVYYTAPNGETQIGLFEGFKNHDGKTTVLLKRADGFGFWDYEIDLKEIPLSKFFKLNEFFRTENAIGELHSSGFLMNGTEITFKGEKAKVLSYDSNSSSYTIQMANGNKELVHSRLILGGLKNNTPLKTRLLEKNRPYTYEDSWEFLWFKGTTKFKEKMNVYGLVSGIKVFIPNDKGFNHNKILSDLNVWFSRMPDNYIKSVDQIEIYSQYNPSADAHAEGAVKTVRFFNGLKSLTFEIFAHELTHLTIYNSATDYSDYPLKQLIMASNSQSSRYHSYKIVKFDGRYLTLKYKDAEGKRIKKKFDLNDPKDLKLAKSLMVTDHQSSPGSKYANGAVKDSNTVSKYGDSEFSLIEDVAEFSMDYFSTFYPAKGTWFNFFNLFKGNLAKFPGRAEGFFEELILGKTTNNSNKSKGIVKTDEVGKAAYEMNSASI